MLGPNITDNKVNTTAKNAILQMGDMPLSSLSKVTSLRMELGKNPDILKTQTS